MSISYLLLGSNLGDRELLLQQAAFQISKLVGPVIHKSDIFITKAWGNTNQADFYNQAICIETKLDPNALLSTILKIEEALGRKRNEKWEARTIDIDILFFNEEIINTSHLTIPHPFIQERKFVLAPLCQIAPQIIHPLFKKSIEELLVNCKDPLTVEILH
jgi:2-amino-4-hydroxy-6-hydroxymethyldihydropteridine diphosphokinase